MALPELDITLHWVGLRVVDPSEQTVGTVEAVFADAATSQAEWALVQTEGGNGSKFVPLLDARQDGDDVRIAFDRTAVTGAPVILAPDELTEEEEAQLYTHYGLPFDESGSVLPASEATPPDVEMPAPPTTEAAADEVTAKVTEADRKRRRRKKDEEAAAEPDVAVPPVASALASPLEVPAVIPPVDAAPAAALAADVPPPSAEPSATAIDEPTPVADVPPTAATPVIETPEPVQPAPRPTPVPAWEPVPPAPSPKKFAVPAGAAALVLLWLWRRRRR